MIKLLKPQARATRKQLLSTLPRKEAALPILILLLLLLTAMCLPAKAQSRRRAVARTSGSQAPQMQMGFKAGITLGHAEVSEFYAVRTEPTRLVSTRDQKTYDGSFAHQNTQVGLEMQFMVNSNLALSLQPGFYTYGYGYQSSFAWTLADDASLGTTLDLTHAHRLRYLEFPLLARYFIGYGPIRPYVQGGAWIGWLQGAQKDLATTLEDNTAGGTEPLRVQTEETLGIDALYLKRQTGWIAGAGVAFDLGDVPDNSSSSLGIVRFLLSVNYRRGFGDITDPDERFVDRRLLSGAYDVQDDLSLANIEISLSCLFTFKYDYL